MMKRRSFLKQTTCAALGSAGAAGAISNLANVAAATSTTALQSGDYKALVCVFLQGGNDGDNTVIPYGESDYNAYAAARTILAVPRAQLLSIPNADTGGRQWAFHPNFAEMQPLFNQKKLAIVANTGPLLAPTTRDQFRARTVPLPPQLFSHSDQVTHWQTSWPDQVAKTGWGGRLADVINSFNSGAQLSMSISLAGANVFQIGSEVFPYSVSPTGAISLWYYNEAWSNPETLVTKAMLDASYGNLFEKSYSQIFKRSIENSQKLTRVLAGAPAINTVFPEKVRLAEQLKMVAKLISVRGALGVRRQVFFVEAHGFDTHGEQPVTHANLLREVSQSLGAFYQATVELGVANNVTTFTESEFGRTYKSNGKGSDHGWGNHQFVMGGAVKGGQIYGTMPIQRINGPDDTSDGRWIPTLSIDEYAGTLAQWFGVLSTDLPQILPNIGRFNRSNLGFLA
jgi:uncharacterized protein (DUF1501 family)